MEQARATCHTDDCCSDELPNNTTVATTTTFSYNDADIDTGTKNVTRMKSNDSNNNCDEVSQRSLDLLDQMREMILSGDSNVKSEIISYTSLMNSLLNDADRRVDTSVLQADKMLDRMKKVLGDDADEKRRSYDALIQSWMDTSDASNEADDILQRLDHVLGRDVLDTNQHSYTALIYSWMDNRSGKVDVDASQQADDVLERLEKLNKDDMKGLQAIYGK